MEPPAKRAKPHRSESKRLIVVLENASLEVVKAGKSFELLNCDKHKGLMKKHDKDPSLCRPDITHQCLLMLLDSPLNRAGLLQVYIHTVKNVLIEINPETRIPRTFDRFCGLMVQLLHKLSIRAAEGGGKLLKVIKNPVADHLPAGCIKLTMSYNAKCEAVPAKMLIPENRPLAVVIGSMAHGKVEVDYTEEEKSISNYPLSAALACSKMCTAAEEVWGVL